MPVGSSLLGVGRAAVARRGKFEFLARFIVHLRTIYDTCNDDPANQVSNRQKWHLKYLCFQ
jgi:hypothetical protein